jgi:hypothetical protein
MSSATLRRRECCFARGAGVAAARCLDAERCAHWNHRCASGGDGFDDLGASDALQGDLPGEGRLRGQPPLWDGFRLSPQASTSQSCGNGPLLNCPAWNRMSGSSSSGPLKKRTILPTSAASGGPPRTIR